MLAAVARAQPWQYSYDSSGNQVIRVAEAVAPPLILRQPQNQVVAPGELASFSVTVADTRAVAYQWRFNNADLPAQTNDTLLVLNSGFTNQGAYSVFISNSSGSVTSDIAQLYIDTDGDGLLDSWELTYFGNLTSQRGGGDADGDGVSNVNELLFGTNPTNSASRRWQLTIRTDGGSAEATPVKIGYDPGETVTLTATPSNSFQGWLGDLMTRSNPATLIMNSNKTVLARFTPLLPSPGLVAFWRGESDATDLIGGHHGTFYNGTNAIPPNVTTSGLVGGAFDFNGSNYVRVPDSPELKPEQITIEAWVYPTAQISTPQTIIARGSSINDDDAWWLGLQSGLLRFDSRHLGSAGMHQLYASFSSLPLNKWLHLAATFDGSIKRIYLNGALAAESSSLGPLVYDTAAVPMTIGSDWVTNSSAQPFNGRLDEMSLYNRPLSPDDVAGIYAANYLGKSIAYPYFTSAAAWPDALFGNGYTQNVRALMGTPPINFSLVGGQIPPGFTFSPRGVLSGTPTNLGTFNFTIRATDGAGLSTEQLCTLQIFAHLPAAPGLVAWWRAENDASDAVGTNHGILSNGVTFASGKVGRAFSFDGISGKVAIPEASSIDLSRMPGWTIEAWVRPISFTVQTYPTIYSEGRWGVSIGLLYSAGNPDSYINNSALFLGAMPFQLNAWNHVALTFDGATRLFYLNGAFAGSAISPPIIHDDTGSSIGDVLLQLNDFRGTNQSRFAGQIDEVSIYNRVLGATEIASVFNAGSAGKANAGPYFTSSPSLPDAVTSRSYTQAVTSARGIAPVVYSVSAGTLPPGLALNSSGVLTGVSSNLGIYHFTVRVTDGTGLFSEQVCTLRVVGPRTPPPGTVAWWRAENNAFDAIGTNHGTLSNGVVFAAGNVGQAFSFDGIDDKISIPESPAIDLSRIRNWTIETWVRPTGLSQTYPTIYSEGRWAASLGVDRASGKPDAWINNIYHFVGTIVVPLNTWTHLALSYAGGDLMFYVNGVAAGSVSAPAIVPDDNGSSIGNTYIPAGLANPSYFQGQIDELSIYNRALAADEIVSIYNAGAAGKTVVGPFINTPPTLPDAALGRLYTQTFTSVRGTAPVAYALSGGALPLGVRLNPNGVLSGIPAASGDFTFTVRATDAAGLVFEQLYSLAVLRPILPGPGLVAWWRGENNADDAAGTNHGTTNGTTFAEGKIGQAFLFDGTNDSVEIPDAPALRPASVTLDAWIMLNDGTGSRTIIGKPLGNTTIDSYKIGLLNGPLVAGVADSSGFGELLRVAFSPGPGRWSHVAYTFDDTSKQQILYLDGTNAASGRLNKTIEYDSHPVILGRDNEFGSPKFFFSGRIDEAAIHNRALNAREIAAIFDAGPAGRTTAGPYFNSPLSLPAAFVGQPYTQAVTAVRGTPPVVHALSGGSLPPGLALSAEGVLSGTPSSTGNFDFMLRAIDAANLFSEQTFSLQVFARIPPPPGIVAWWRAENNARDAVGSNHGVLTNGATFAPGKTGQAFALDGRNDFVDIPDAPGLRLNSLTLEAWILLNAEPLLAPQFIFAKPFGTGSSNSFALWLDGALKAVVSDNADFAPPALAFPFSPVPGRWYHVACTFDDVTKKQALYLDGNQVAFGVANKTINYDNHSLMLGGDFRGGAPVYFFPGRIDEAAIYNRALDPSEIASIYSAGPAGKTASGPYFNTPPRLPDIVLLQPATQALTTVRGTLPVSYTLAGGALPGLSLSSAGVLAGTPTVPGRFTFIARATDSVGLVADQPFSITVLDRRFAPEGLVAWWKAENNAQDEFGVNPGLLRNGATFAAGEVEQAFSLDGVDDSIDIADAPSLRPPSLTLETWVLFDATNGIRQVFAKPLGAGTNDSYALWFDNGLLKAGVADAAAFGPLLSAPFAAVTGRWYHVAYTFDDASKQQALYLDGVQLTNGIGTKSVGYDIQPMLLGRDIENGTPNYFLRGRIDEAAIYNRALGAWEVSSIYEDSVLGKRLAPVGPSLSVLITAGNTVRIAWPSSAIDFSLQQSTNLNTPIWIAPSETVTDNGTNKFIIVTPSTRSRFYRLSKP